MESIITRECCIILSIIKFITIFTLLVSIIHRLETIERSPIDYELKVLDQCYLTVHNFISFKSDAFLNSRDFFKYNTTQNFKTYIYSYTKPYLLELVQNSTKDCLCCN